MDFLLHRFDMPRGRPFIYDYCVMSTSQIKPKEIWSDRKRSSEWERKFLTTAVNLWQIWERFRVQWRPASIHRYSLALSRDIFITIWAQTRRYERDEWNKHITWMQLRSIYYDYYYWSEIIVCEDGNSHKAIWWVLRKGDGSLGNFLSMKNWTFSGFWSFWIEICYFCGF